MPSLYRKWRSRSFDDFVGQEHVVRTLRNAVRHGRIAHAYLFTGPRGTGKTSTARILAKAVNCRDPQDGGPCNVCEACRAADEGRAIDVIEIDAASNTSVENVRDLRDRVAYAAGEGRYKVYIVDEVHRLSGAAFDAFLKTLEEPPPHVIFVFASTEPHKVPATIASRCQRFDFRRFSIQEILDHLRHVADEERLAVSQDALRLVAVNAGGSMRDALGLLDQVASYSSEHVDEAQVRDALGLADPLLVSRLTDALLAGEIGRGLAEAGKFMQAGGDPRQLVRQLVEYWRSILHEVTGAPTESLAIDPALMETIAEHSKRLDQVQVLGMLRAITTQEFSPKFNVPAALPFEVGFVQAAIALQPALEIGPKPSHDSRPTTVASASPPPSSVPLASTLTPPVVAANGRSEDEGNEIPDSKSPPAIVGDGSVEGSWDAIVQNLRPRSHSLQAVLKSGYFMRDQGGEVTVGFLHPFHQTVFADPKKRRVLEEVIAETVGASYRVKCIHVTREEIQAARGANAVTEDDGFIDEVAERLRQHHVKQLNNGGS